MGSDSDIFHAPSTSDVVDVLVSEHANAADAIRRVADFMGSDDAKRALYYFEQANPDYHGVIPSYHFDPVTARTALDALTWDKAIDRIGVRDFMPAKRRQEWHEQIKQRKTPEFTEANARSTLRSLLDQRMDFLAEMVDGIFRGLSREHVTNRPEGFTKRFILPYVYSEWSSARDTDLIHDLRGIVAKFMGWEPPSYGATRSDIDRFRRYHGQWFSWDGGAIRCRVYKKGTGHLEVHPTIARRLNQVLAHLYPTAIPNKYRETQKNAKDKKEPELMHNLLPPEVRKVLNDTYKRNAFELELRYGSTDIDKHVLARVDDVIEAIGGVRVERGKWKFDYAYREVLYGVISSGTLPDHVTHQYYPTPEWLAIRAIEWAEPHQGDVCVEPSAGQGAIAQHMPAGTVCMDVSPLHVEILKAKGLLAEQGDCLIMTWNADCIVMNPPYSQGRWKSHVEHMITGLNKGGRLVAILPASAREKIKADGCSIEWSETLERPFPGVSIDIVLMRVTK